MDHIDIAKELELDEVEQCFRNYHFSHRNVHMDKVMSFDQVTSIIRSMKFSSEEQEKLITEILCEDLYIGEKTEVAVYKHLRFLPTFYHTHNFIEILYVLTGQCTQFINDTEMTLKPGDIYIVPPGTKHAISNFSDSCIILNLLIRSSNFDSAFLNVLSDRDVIADFFSRCLFTKHNNAYLYFPTQRNPAIRDFIAYAYEEYHSKKRYKHRMINSLISAFFIILLREHEKDVVVVSNSIENYDSNIILILNYLQNNFKTVTLTELATLFHYSERHVGRIIREHCGQSFSDLIRVLKLGNADRLLRNSSLSIQTIAEMSGYTNMSHFYRVFKSHFGTSPSEYRDSTQ